MLRYFKRSPSDFEVKEIDATNLQECADIHQASFSNAWSDGEIAELLKSKGTKGLLARKQSDLKNPVNAFLIYRCVANELEIITIATNPKARKNGAATILLSQMIRLALSDRMDKIFLEVDETNSSAMALYKKFGFVTIGQRKGYYKSSDKTATGGDALIMRLDLKR